MKGGRPRTFAIFSQLVEEQDRLGSSIIKKILFTKCSKKIKNYQKITKKKFDRLGGQ